MEISTATSSAASLAANVSYWQNIPAAVYVLMGVVISGAFTIFADYRNNKNSRELKELENKNSWELKELENKNNLEVQALEIVHKEKLQKAKEQGDKALRLLDDKIKTFSDFHSNYSEILKSGTDQSRMEKIETFRTSVYKVRLLVPSKASELAALDGALLAFSNFLFAIIHNEKTFSSEEIKREEMAVLSRKVNLTTNIILDSLSDNL